MKQKTERPALIFRVSLLLAIALFAYIDNNPIVRLEAWLGLSPSPIERFFGVKSLFSGMTEGVNQFARLNLAASFNANPFAPLVLPFVSFCCLNWWFPVIDSRRKEVAFFVLFVFLSLVVNFV
jgi:hypothetical protein